MFRYLAIAWDFRSEVQVRFVETLLYRVEQAAMGMQSVFAAEGVNVLVAGDRASSTWVHRLEQHSGVVLDTIFVRNANEGGQVYEPDFDGGETRRILETSGRRLITHYWGRYVAFLFDVDTRLLRVVRDPTGSLSCFHSVHESVHLFSSSISICLKLKALRATWNWRVIQTLVVKGGLPIRETGINEVTELLPGECLELQSGRESSDGRKYWDPYSISMSDPCEDIYEAAALVRQSTDYCLSSWASRYPRILHQLSGGLDSSIVLAALNGAPTRPDVTCVNCFDESYEGDERAHARSVAGRWGNLLIECERRVSDIDLDLVFRMVPTVQPQSWIYQLHEGRISARFAAENRACAVCSGWGGDQLFFRDYQILAAADYVRMHGIGREFLRVLLGTVRLRDCSIWHVMRKALTLGVFRFGDSPVEQIGAQFRFPTRDVVERVRACAYDLYLDDERLPPGKRQQVLSLGHAYPYHDPFEEPDGYDVIDPLMSQPLIELCLRIPAFVHISGGVDRSVARRAYADELPRIVYSRRSKGGPTTFRAEFLRSKRAWVADVLLNGRLVTEKLLDRSAIEAFLRQETYPLAAGVGELVMLHLSTEIWMQIWSEHIASS